MGRLRPELVLLHCHGTAEGSLLFEDGRGRADFVPGKGLFPLFKPRPRVLLLNACYSGKVLEDAGDKAAWSDGAIVYINAETPLEVGAGAVFQAQFYTLLLQGECVGDAFESAQQYLANDADFGDLSVPSDAIPPSAKFRLQAGGESVRLPVPADPLEAASSDSPRAPRPRRLSRSTERFVGRRREMAESLDVLLPLPPGVHRGPEAGERRIVTLTREGGIGKTALALEIADWCEERGSFPGGIFELACEPFRSVPEWLSQLLYRFGVPLEEQRGDLSELLAAHLAESFPAERLVLLVLDNLDDLFSQREMREPASAVLETALTATPALRVLATCRWPLGLADHETEVEIKPLDAAEACDVFLSHLTAPVCKRKFRESWGQANGL
ncbi:MAG: AAA family ATPase, partial [Candidatus Competibacteraceae bacterium]